MAGDKGQTIVTQYDFVIMSKGNFRQLSTVKLDNGTYTCTKD